MNGLSLFTGSGIGELAFKHILPDYRTVGYVEIDKYCRSIIRARIRDGLLDDAPIFDDIRVFNERYAESYAGKVDWLSGGYPCQPFSTAARGRNNAEDLWPIMRSVIRRISPLYVFGENVQRKAVDQAVIDLCEDGYITTVRPLSAADVGADHIRERWWVFGNTNNKGEPVGGFHDETSWMSSPRDRGKATGWWEDYPGPMGVDDGVAYRVDRIAACGNGWVPQVVKRILQVTTREEEA